MPNERRSAAAKAVWARPEYRAEHHVAMKAACARPEERTRRSIASKASWSNPERRAKQQVAMPGLQAKRVATMARPESKAKRQAAAKAAWTRPEYRAKQLTVPKTKRQAAAKARWADEEYRAKQQATRARPEVKANRSAVAKAAWTRPDIQWTLDHNHITNRVRGVLCQNCNRGTYQEDSTRLRRAADYFEYPPFDLPRPSSHIERRVLRAQLLVQQQH